MAVREILAHNLRALMDNHRTLNTSPAIEKRSVELGLKVGKSTVDRVLKQSTPLNIDYLEVIAKMFDVDCWQILVQDMRPRNPPVLRSIGQVEDQLYQKIDVLVDELAALRNRQLHQG